MRPVAKHPFLEHDGVMAFAHRGGNRNAPENTMAAFADAVAMGYRYLETDVHASLDGVAFAFHDDDLTRMTGDALAISTLKAADIEAISLDGGHAIPRMSDLLEAFPDANFNIDAKAWPVVEPLGALINQMQVHERICVGAFSDARIDRLLEITQHRVCHGVGPKQATRFRLAAASRLPMSFEAGCLQFPPAHKSLPMVTKASVAYAHKVGMQMHVWTINDESTMHDLLDKQVDGIMTDDCALLKSVLQARNLW